MKDKYCQVRKASCKVQCRKLSEETEFIVCGESRLLLSEERSCRYSSENQTS